MIKAVLIDLDNTLIRNPDHVFASRFLTLWHDHFQAAGMHQADDLLREAIRQMRGERTGEESNQAVIERVLGIDRASFIALFDTFYSDVYPSLQALISPLVGAAQLIDELRQMGYKIVIATNPLYPLTAIQQRMAWGDLNADVTQYDLVTSADIMHFIKPDPAYYAEILGHIHVEPDEAIMIGNHLINDIQAAATIGIHCIHVPDYDLSAVVDRVRQIADAPPTMPLAPRMIAPQLRGNIGAVFGFLDTVKAHFWLQRPIPNEWSIIQILCHLAESEVAHERPRLRAILQEDNPFITQPKQPGPRIDECADEGYSIARTFMARRLETIALLEGITAADWQRPARHSVFGLTTLLEMAYFTAQHDRLHLHQLCQTIGQCE